MSRPMAFSSRRIAAALAVSAPRPGYPSTTPGVPRPRSPRSRASGGPTRPLTYTTSSSRHGSHAITDAFRKATIRRTMAEPLISRLTSGSGPFTRLNARNHTAIRAASTETNDPATASSVPSELSRARAQIREPTSHPRASPIPASISRTISATAACAGGLFTSDATWGARSAPARSPSSSPAYVASCSDAPRRKPLRAVTRWGIASAVAAGYRVVAALVVGGVEKLDAARAVDLGGLPVLRPAPSHPDARAALGAALAELGPDAVLDLSDEPVLGYQRR